MVFTFGSLDRGLSNEKIGGGECVGWEMGRSISVSGGNVFGCCVVVVEGEELGLWVSGSSEIKWGVLFWTRRAMAGVGI